MAVTRIQPNQIKWFFVRGGHDVCLVFNGPAAFDAQRHTFNPNQIDGLHTIPEKRATYPQAKRLWPALAPDKCPICLGHGSKPGMNVCPDCKPVCTSCRRRFNAHHQEGPVCGECARPSSWERIMKDDTP